MSKLKVTLNRAGVRELLRSEELRAVCREHAEAIRSRCGAGYAADDYTGVNRVNAMVYADTAAARRDNLENETILRALK